MIENTITFYGVLKKNSRKTFHLRSNKYLKKKAKIKIFKFLAFIINRNKSLNIPKINNY